MSESTSGRPSVDLSTLIAADAARIYRGLTSSIEQSGITGGRAVIEPAVGGCVRWSGGRLGTITGTVAELTPGRRLVISLDPLPWIDGCGLGPQPSRTRLELTVRDSPSGGELLLHQLVETSSQARCLEYEWRSFYLTPLRIYLERWSAAVAAGDTALLISSSTAFCWGDEHITVLASDGGAFFELPRRIALRLLELFSAPTTRRAALSRVDDAEHGAVSEAIDALLATLVLVPAEHAAPAPTRTRWEPHDRLFHAISMGFGNHGWHQLGVDALAPAVKPPSPGRIVELADTELPDRSLRGALAARRSTREFVRRPLSFAALSGFLQCARNARGPTAKRWNHEWLPGDHVSRCYPSGGALYSTEVYVLVGEDGVERIGAGAYHYCPARHVLEELCTGSSDIGRILAAVSSESMLRPPPGPPADLAPPVMVVISSRLRRVSAKYGGFAYSLVLEEVGAMQQTFSLVAAALGLGGCALGASPGAVSLLQQQCAVSPLDEPIVGFYMLGNMTT